MSTTYICPPCGHELAVEERPTICPRCFNPRGMVLARTTYDYEKQAWVVDGRYVDCGHTNNCGCYGRAHEGELAVTPHDVECVLSAEDQFIDDFVGQSYDDLCEL